MDVLQPPMPTLGAMLTRDARHLGVMISASPNLFDDNGIKLFGPDGFKLSDDVEQQIEALLDDSLVKKLAASAHLGRAKRIDGASERYIEFAKRTLPRALSLEGLRVVVDCANGAAYKVVPDALWELGDDVVSIGVEPDGFNINKDCGSTSPEMLCRKVRELRADIGIALDGDADRLIIADERAARRRRPVARRDRAELARGRSPDEPGHRRNRDVESGLERFLGGMACSCRVRRSAIATCSSGCKRWLQCRR